MAMTVGLTILGRWRPAAIVLATPVVLLLVTQPRLALYQYIAVLFMLVAVEYTIPILLVDMSAALLILAAVVDLLTDDSLPRRFPPLTTNFTLLLLAVFVCGLFAYEPDYSIRTFARILVLTVSFLAAYRLTRRVELVGLIKFFFWVCVFHALVALVPFVATGGTVRSFGIASKILDELAMVAFPMGLALYLWHSQRRGLIYLIGALVVFGGLVATQSRAPIVLSMTAALVTSILSYRQAIRKLSTVAAIRQVAYRVKQRTVLLIIIGLAVAAAAVLLMTDALAMVLSRFDELLSARPTGTFLVRLSLWKAAVTAFWDHPILGLGPGNFRFVTSVYPELNLDPVYFYGRGLSAHNLFLHYLAETGVIGASMLAALFINQFRLGLSAWRRGLMSPDSGCRLVLLVVGILFLITTFVEAGWMWGQFGYVFVFFAALMARAFRRSEPSP